MPMIECHGNRDGNIRNMFRPLPPSTDGFRQRQLERLSHPSLNRHVNIGLLSQGQRETVIGDLAYVTGSRLSALS
jgi:hypothetical protein